MTIRNYVITHITIHNYIKMTIFCLNSITKYNVLTQMYKTYYFSGDLNTCSYILN